MLAMIFTKMFILLLDDANLIQGKKLDTPTYYVEIF